MAASRAAIRAGPPKMCMQMVDGLSALLSIIDDGRKPSGKLVAKRARNNHHMPQEAGVVLLGVTDLRKAGALLGDQQHMHRRLGSNVLERVAELVVVHSFRGDLLGQYLIEYGPRLHIARLQPCQDRHASQRRLMRLGNLVRHLSE